MYNDNILSLTAEQKLLLTWMATGHTFEVCTDYCSHFGDVQPKQLIPVQLHRKTINKLKREGLVSFESKFYYGLRWDVFSITDKGASLV
ncbi:hypothetical protein VST7929_02952 [Vibrio stylophorae]|uniref:MarR family transcriptional regulator n=1 Tax=Vibrio stylophorae TaxID=659351 RepID=A0ABM8ZXC8_9VIBR|nr:hypothetical protein [Vibrio stylophorae]CAH0535374.1 hypothetical protein VST7929_02952 [Vibrio stylophorae]